MIDEVIIDNKKYVIMPYDKFQKITQAKVHKAFKGNLLNVEEAKARTKERIAKWAKSE